MERSFQWCEKLNMRFHSPPGRSRRLLYTGIILTALGLTLLICSSSLYEYIIRKAIRLTPASTAFTRWQKTDPLTMDFYFFNWTNAEQLNDVGVKPRVEEVGPYRFKLVIERVNVSWPEKGAVRYQDVRRYYWDEESPRKLSDVVTTLNVVALGMAHYCKSCSFFYQKSVSFTLSTLGDVHITKTVGELLFEGYSDGLLTAVGMIPFMDVKDKFGFFYDRNGTKPEGGEYTVGADNNENFGKLLLWNNKTTTPYFQGQCSEIRGSAGAFFQPKPERTSFFFFDGSYCKPLLLVYEEDVVVKGLPGLKFSGKYMFDNGTYRPENDCPCNGECIPTGVLNMSACAMGSPTFLSLPHFYGADPYYLTLIDGLRPSKEKHDFSFTLEEDTGTVIQVAGRAQVNMLLEPIDGIGLYKNVPEVFFPIFYTENLVTVQDHDAFFLKIFRSVPAIFSGTAVFTIVLGSIFILYVCVSLKRVKQPALNGVNNSSRLPEVEPLNKA